MTRVTFTSPDLLATEAFGEAVAHLLRSGDVVLLRGELGAGKTALVRGIARGLGIAPGAVSSPTFVVVNQYAAPGAITSLTHVDAYRVTSVDELDAAGWDRLFSPGGAAAPGTAAVIEWPDRIAAALPAEAVSVELTHAGEHEREIAAAFPDSWALRPDLDLLTGRRAVVCPVTGRWVPPTSKTYPFSDARSRDADLYRWIVPVEDGDR